jgi:hypothetical protein
MMLRTLAIVCVLALGAVFGACAGAPPKVRLDDAWPKEVDAYEDVTERWTRKTELQTSYQQVIELVAILKSPEWRAARAVRDANLRGVQGQARDAVLAQAQADMAGPWEVELLVTTWDRRENDLNRGAKSVWRVVLIDDQGNEIEHLEIVKDKRPANTVRADFPEFGDFATAYVARFPRDKVVLGAGVRKVRLRMSSPRGAVEVAWEAP